MTPTDDIILQIRDVGDPATRWPRLRMVLKRLLRVFGFKAVEVKQKGAPAEQERT